MQLVLSATLSRLYLVLGNFHTSTDVLVQNLFSFLISTCVSLAQNLPIRRTSG